MRERRATRTSPFALVLAALLTACASTGRPPCDPAICGQDPLITVEEGEDAEEGGLCRDGNTYVAGEDPKLPWLRYVDGQMSLSNSCGVRVGSKLNRRVPPMYVNGLPIGFC